MKGRQCQNQEDQWMSPQKYLTIVYDSLDTKKSTKVIEQMSMNLNNLQSNRQEPVTSIYICAEIINLE